MTKFVSENINSGSKEKDEEVGMELDERLRNCWWARNVVAMGRRGQIWEMLGGRKSDLFETNGSNAYVEDPVTYKVGLVPGKKYCAIQHLLDKLMK